MISAGGAAWMPIVHRRRVFLGAFGVLGDIGVLGVTAVVLTQLRRRATVASVEG